MIDAMIKIGNFDIIIPDGKSNLRDVSQILDIHIKQICISSDQPKGADNINMSASQSKMRFVDRLYDKYKIDVEDISIHLSFYKIEENPYIVNLEENRRKSLILLLVSFLTWSLLSLFNYFNIAEIFMEAYLVIIWFFLWTFAEFEFIDRPKLKYDKLDMAQLASMKIVFKHE